MTVWRERPTEIATLFNPAFCAIIIREALASYDKERSDGMPFSLVFLVLPIVLHEETRKTLPKRTVRSMVDWCSEHPDILHEFPSRAKRLVPFTK